jgi:ribosomal protein S18 acetylase RimI-like enzyme
MTTIQQVYDVINIGSENFNTIGVLMMAAIGRIHIISHRKKTVGFAIRTNGYLHYLAIKKEYQGKGYGKKLFAKIAPYIKRLKVREDNKPAIKLYNSFGFSVVRDTYTINGKRLLMEKLRSMKKC